MKYIRWFAQWKTIIHFHYPKNEIFSPAIFTILREPIIVQKQTIPQKKALNLSFFWVPKAHRRGIIMRAPRALAVKS